MNTLTHKDYLIALHSQAEMRAQAEQLRLLQQAKAGRRTRPSMLRRLVPGRRPWQVVTLRLRRSPVR